MRIKPGRVRLIAVGATLTGPPQDRNVPILVSGPSAPHDRMNTAPVETTQIAPTLLELLGLNPHQLQAVQQEGTPVLPGF
jgi:arylsulfatase A-like enzyme